MLNSKALLYQSLIIDFLWDINILLQLDNKIVIR